MKRGSALLLLVFITTMLSIFISIVWRSTAYMFDFSLKKIESVQHDQIAQGLLRYGIALAQENFKKFKSGASTVTFKVNDWYAHGAKKYNGIIKLEYIPDKIKVLVQLYEHETKLNMLSCFVKPTVNDGKQLFMVEQWNTHAQSI